MSTKANQPLSFTEMILDRLNVIDFPQRPTQTATAAADAGRSSLPTQTPGSGNSSLPKEVMQRIERAAYIAHELDQKSDREIAQLLLNTVWGDLRTGTLEAELVDQAITRLRGDHK